MYEETRTETVGADGMVHIEVPGVKPGESVEVTLRRDDLIEQPTRVPDEFERYRTMGGFEGKIRIADDSDAPLYLAKDTTATKPKRQPGSLKGLFTVPPDFDDPIPGMEEYS